MKHTCECIVNIFHNLLQGLEPPVNALVGFGNTFLNASVGFINMCLEFLTILQ